MVTPDSAVKELRELLSVHKGNMVAVSDVFTQKRIMELIFRILKENGYGLFVDLLGKIVIE